jgi:hypothetical protein
MYATVNELGNRIIQMQEKSVEESFHTALQDLEKSWGNAYQSKLQSLNNAMEHIFPKISGHSHQEIREEFVKHGLFNSPIFMKCMAAIGELSSETSSRGLQNISPMDASMKFQQMKSDPATADILMNPRHPRYEEVKSTYSALSKIVYGE